MPEPEISAEYIIRSFGQQSANLILVILIFLIVRRLW